MGYVRIGGFEALFLQSHNFKYFSQYRSNYDGYMLRGSKTTLLMCHFLYCLQINPFDIVECGSVLYRLLNSPFQNSF